MRNSKSELARISTTTGQGKGKNTKVNMCKTCGKTFTRVARLRIHERTHVWFILNLRLGNVPLYVTILIVKKCLWKEVV